VGTAESMFRSGYALDTDDKLYAAVHNKAQVAVWQKGKIHNYGGQIESHDEKSVIIEGGTFFKDLYKFKIR
jgi:hypothetical protein